MSHTPGPWYVRTDGTIGSVQRGGMVVAHPVIEPKNEGDQAANARLIAAAPDLLAACEKALYALKGREHDGFLRNAIKKAKGS